ncbi:RNA recognition motif [Carpediemonas membranifera]|uniref:RNA recognition motif n=1 Tax=Carpediemonas membranifera TaxID=201153 RepID=A0A8J6BVM3_9EUKA|nr:RNA recognition motif [Carpediemonas membranifera]|eukprot:KAG9391551.1 RNA recognition motif [Carpediemonas membranifera]
MMLNSPTSCGFGSLIDVADDAMSTDDYQARSVNAEPIYIGPIPHDESMDDLEIEFSAMSLPEDQIDSFQPHVHVSSPLSSDSFPILPPEHASAHFQPHFAEPLSSFQPMVHVPAVSSPLSMEDSPAFPEPQGTQLQPPLFQPYFTDSSSFQPAVHVASVGSMGHFPMSLQTSSAPTTQFQPHFGDHPSRTLYVQHSAIGMLSVDEIQQLFGQFGDIRAVFTECASQGYVLVSYYDIRHAKAAVRRLSGFRYRNIRLDIHYSIPVGIEALQNQGTIVVFNLDPASTNEELARLFGDYGELKEIRETPNKKHHKFIEFFDVRHADAAMAGLNKREIRGKRIKIEPSRPGGARRNMVQRVQPSGPRPSVQVRHVDGVLPRWD